jgi:hypothetical protein
MLQAVKELEPYFRDIVESVHPGFKIQPVGYKRTKVNKNIFRIRPAQLET